MKLDCQGKHLRPGDFLLIGVNANAMFFSPMKLIKLLPGEITMVTCA